MNCKPGDLAVVVGTPDIRQYYPQAIGKIVTCLKGYEAYGRQCWVTEPPFFDNQGVRCGMYDAGLKPIRDPGDDAVDESKAWLPPVPLPKIDLSLLPAKETS